MKFLLLIFPLLVACQQGSRGNDSEITVKNEVSQEFKTNAAIFSDEIVLSDLASKMLKHTTECGPNPEPGKRYTYEVQNDRLVIDDQRTQVTYDRETDEGGLLFGKWSMVSSSDLSMTSGSLEISQSVVHFISNCAH